MDLIMAAKWLRARARHETELLKDACTFRAPDRSRLARLWQFETDGGLMGSRDLVPIVPGERRAARLLLQLDGDAMLFVPTDFGGDPGDAPQVVALHAELADELAGLHANLPYHWAALVSVTLKFGLSAMTLLSAPDGVGSLLKLIAAPETLATESLAQVTWWHVAGTLSGPAGLVFGGTLRRALGRLLRLV
jgi:hypothetical protein